MSDETVIRTEGLGKCYFIKCARADGSALPWRRLERTVHWAVRGVDLEVPAGQVLGLIGPNGAGKSTLLQLLARTTHPSEGGFSIAGRVSSMLEVGVGFSWELTGRENIYLSGTLLGMRRHEVTARLDEIVAFAGIEKYLDVPVKRYSSGMYVRLGFSVAVHLEADVMLVDEVLSVGDASFRRQCHDKMRQAADEGRTIVYVSHGLGSVLEFCDRALLLDQGRIQADDTPQRVISRYLHAQPSPRFEAEPTGDSQVRHVEVVPAEGEAGDRFDAAGGLQVAIDYELVDHAPGCVLLVAICGADGHAVFTSRSDHGGASLAAEPGLHRSALHLPPGLLGDGDYHVAVALLDGMGQRLWSGDLTARFTLQGGAEEVPGFAAGSSRLHLPGTWS